MVLVAWLSAVASAEAQSTGGVVDEGPASIVVLDVGGYVASGPFSGENAAHGLMPFRLGAMIDVLTLDPHLSFAVTGSVGGLVEAWLREPGAFTDATYSDELFAANQATGVRLHWRVSPEVTARFGADAIWPLRDVHDGDLGAIGTVDTASASAQAIDPWDPFLYQGDYVQLVPRAEIELRIDAFFGGIEGAFAFGVGLGRQGDGAATGLLLLRRQTPAGGLGRALALRTRRLSRLLRASDIEALRALRPAGAGASLGLDHHRLGSAMAEALLHGAGRNRSRGARLQAQRRPRSRLGRRSAGVRTLALVGLVVFVAHPVALLGAEKPAVVSIPINGREPVSAPGDRPSAAKILSSPHRD